MLISFTAICNISFSFRLSHLWFTGLLKSENLCLAPNVVTLSTIIFQIFFCSSLPLLCTPVTQVLGLLIWFHRSLKLFLWGFFWYPSSLCSSEWIISLFKLTDTFFCQVHSAIDLMSKFFLLNVLLILKFSLGSLIKFLFLCCESLSFYSLAFISHEIKSLIIIQVSHLEVVSTAAFHRRIGQSFLVLYMLSSFVVYRGHFEY